MPAGLRNDNTAVSELPSARGLPDRRQMAGGGDPGTRRHHSTLFISGPEGSLPVVGPFGRQAESIVQVPSERGTLPHIFNVTVCNSRAFMRFIHSTQDSLAGLMVTSTYLMPRCRSSATVSLP